MKGTLPLHFKRFRFFLCPVVIMMGMNVQAKDPTQLRPLKVHGQNTISLQQKIQLSRPTSGIDAQMTPANHQFSIRESGIRCDLNVQSEGTSSVTVFNRHENTRDNSFVLQSESLFSETRLGSGSCEQSLTFQLLHPKSGKVLGVHCSQNSSRDPGLSLCGRDPQILIGVASKVLSPYFQMPLLTVEKELDRSSATENQAKGAGPSETSDPAKTSSAR